jgi:UDP-2,3-diacylglucosamine pyrophosphatase LpxH
MKLKYLAISDTHLGERTSLLCFPRGRKQLCTALQELFADAGASRVEVEELILVGDIPDRCLSSTSQIVKQTNAFMAALAGVLDVGRVVYVPGNHDHTIWTAYDRARTGGPVGTTALDGDRIVSNGAVAAHALPAAAELLQLFFGAADANPWRAADGSGGADFVVANPVYGQSFRGRTYLFVHGTHFRRELTAPKWLRQLVDGAQLDQLVAGIELETELDMREAHDLPQLESLVTPFVNSLWPSALNHPTLRSDDLWYLLCAISGKFGKRRAIPRGHILSSWPELSAAGSDRFYRLTPEYDAPDTVVAPLESYRDGSIERCRRWFLGKALSHVAGAGLSTEHVTFVYGDTHDGGVGRLPGDAPGREVRIYNTGAWVVHDKDDHPPCHLFAVDEDGTEYLADVSFDHVRVDGRALLESAAEDAENKKRAASRALRMLLSVLPGA